VSEVINRSHLDNLLGALLQVPGLADSDDRDAQVEELTRRLGRSLDAVRFADARPDLSSILAACEACTGGLPTFVRIVHRRHPGDASARAVELADQAVGTVVLSTPDRDTLERHLSGIPARQIADAVGELVDAAALRSLPSWRDIPGAIRMLESLPVPDDGVPQVLTFVDRLAHVVNSAEASGLRRWINTVAGGLGVDRAALDRLRATSERSVAAGRLSTAPIQRRWTASDQPPTRRRPDDGRIWGGGVPYRNRNFSGRGALLDRLGEALRTASTASVLPQTLHGMGGVGKTQLVIEYIYRHIDEYDIVWWIAAEQTSSVLASLSELGVRLGLSTTEDRVVTARTVLDHLASTDLSWLLVYDNADDPTTLTPYVPATGGHVILTTRNQEWSTVGKAIEVDVFLRPESIELLQRRSMDEDTGVPRIHAAEANDLAEKLGDLPLALEQAVAWHLATSMSIREYLQLLDSHLELLDEGRPPGYPLSVAAFVTLAVEKLRETAPAAAQLFEMFAYLGGEPVTVSLLRQGRGAEISPELRQILAEPISTNRTVRDLGRYGLAKVAQQKVQVHRLVQRVLRDSLPGELADRTLRSVQQLLAKANPGDPDENPQADREDIGPHIDAADLINAPDIEARQAVLDHSRYLYTTGDYENSLQLAERAAAAWALDAGQVRLGPDGELTLRARAQVANAYRTLGRSQDAAVVVRDAYERLRASLGPTHEYTLITGNQVGADLRIAGRYREALDFDRESVRLHRDVFEPDNNYLLRARANLAVDHRMIGDFAEAYRIDDEIADRWDDVSATDPRALAAYINLARNCYGLGAYRKGLDLLERWRNPLHVTLGAGHSQVLLSGRTHAILLRKLGRLTDAAELISDNRERMVNRFGPNHEFTIASAVSHTNVLRELGELDEAEEILTEAISRYAEHFGEEHPLMLVAQVNEAVLCRAQGRVSQAQALDERTYAKLGEVLAADHPYTLCAGSSLASDYSLAGDHQAALELSQKMLALSPTGGHDSRNNAEHPYGLMRAVNLSIDLRATGDTEAADRTFEEALEGLRQALGPDHPDLPAIEGGARTEGDIEPPPT
jgi:tetratricopeptide (TPR) repeat protein